MRAIDVRHKGREKVICCWEVDGVLIDPGPEISVGTLLEAIDHARPKAVLLTHIHFDHAGATGALTRRWPDLRVYVHARGAPHMADPAKLVASAGRLYGGEDGLKQTWGEVIPVPQTVTVSGVPSGFRTTRTCPYVPARPSRHQLMMLSFVV